MLVCVGSDLISFVKTLQLKVLFCKAHIYYFSCDLNSPYFFHRKKIDDKESNKKNGAFGVIAHFED